MNEIEDPGLHQIASALIGSAIGKIVGGDAQTGASVAASGTKYNDLNPTAQNQLAYDIKNAENKEELIRLLKYAVVNDEGQLSIKTEENLIDALSDVGYEWNNSLDFKGNINQAIGQFDTPKIQKENHIL